MLQGIDDQDGSCDQGGRQGDHEIYTEFVPHLYTLCACRRDGRIRDDGQVVAEHGAPDNSADEKGHGQVGAVHDLHRNGDQDRDRTHTGAHGHGDQAGDDKETGNGQITGYNIQHEIGRARCAAGLTGQTAESACHQEDEEHDDDVVIPDPLRADVHLFIEAERPVLGKGDDQGQAKGDDDRDHIEAHLSLDRMDILKIYAAPQINNQKDQDRQERFRIWFSFMHG